MPALNQTKYIWIRMMSTTWLTETELQAEGFAEIGDDVRISAHAIFINPEKVSVGSHVRIDAFCILSAGEMGIHIGNNVHISAGVYCYGGGGAVRIEDFVSISGKSSLYTISDDFRDGSMSGPMVPYEYRNLKTGDLSLERHALIGTHAVILPGVTLGVGCSVGALSLVKESIGPYQIVAGNPLRTIGIRDSVRLRNLETQYWGHQGARHRAHENLL
jgi:galactoside O-acetyltransferase